MSSIKNIAIAGATGSLGSVVTKRLLGQFNVTLLKRVGSESAYPEGVKVVEVDYDSLDSLTAALQGQDAVVSTLGTTSGGKQTLLVEAAVAAGVKRFVPSEFGCKLDNPITRKTPIFADKVAIEDLLKAKAAESDLSYTFVYTGAFLDWGLEHNFLLDLRGETVSVLDGGDLPFSATSLSTIADAVAGVLAHPEQTKNRAVHVHDRVTTQNKLLALARQARPDKTWTPQTTSLADIAAASEANAAKGQFDFGTVIGFLYRALFNPAYGNRFQETDNELLGVTPKSDEFVIEEIKRIVG